MTDPYPTTTIPTATAMPSSEPSPERVESSSVGELISEVTQDLSKLMRQELDLAKAELKEEASKAGKGAGMMGGAGVAGYFALLCLTFALIFGIGELTGLAWSSLIVCVIWAGVGALLFLQGKAELKKVNPALPQTTQTLKEDAQWLKNPTR